MKELIKKFFSTPKSQRLSKTLSFVKLKSKAKALYCLFRIINKPGSNLYISYRPDFDVKFHKFIKSQELHRSWITGNEENNYGDISRLYFLYANIEKIVSMNIQGDFAEVGVYKGNSAKIMHLIDSNRKLYLFDTFEGFPEKDVNVDVANPDKKSFKDTSLDYVIKFLGNNKNIVYCKGYFPDTTALVPLETRFAFVQLDCDLYQPTKSGCEYFYPRLTEGGILVVHDYYSGYWPGVTKAVDEFFYDKPESPILIPDKSGSIAVIKNKTS